MRKLVIGLSLLGIVVVATEAFSRSSRDGQDDGAAVDVFSKVVDLGTQVNQAVARAPMARSLAQSATLAAMPPKMIETPAWYLTPISEI